MNDYCRRCLLEKRLAACPPEADPDVALAYRKGVAAIIAENGHLSTPEVDYLIGRLYASLFGAAVDYSAIKRHFNALMLGLEPAIQVDADSAPDPLKRAIQYAMTGNFIDFAALDSVSEDQLRALLDRACDVPVDDCALNDLRDEIGRAERLVLFTDNCGEIVCDKVLLRTLCRLNPRLSSTVIVRGEPVVNDASPEDAIQIDMASVATRVIGNGTGIAGSPLNRLSAEALTAVNAADVLIAKGQANYESLCGCGLNLFYVFMCKCQLFMDRFGVERFSGLLTREKPLQADNASALDRTERSASDI